jgi:hypothetical protein
VVYCALGGEAGERQGGRREKDARCYLEQEFHSFIVVCDRSERLDDCAMGNYERMESYRRVWSDQDVDRGHRAYNCNAIRTFCTYLQPGEEDQPLSAAHKKCQYQLPRMDALGLTELSKQLLRRLELVGHSPPQPIRVVPRPPESHSLSTPVTPLVRLVRLVAKPLGLRDRVRHPLSPRLLLVRDDPGRADGTLDGLSLAAENDLRSTVVSSLGREALELSNSSLLDRFDVLVLPEVLDVCRNAQ